MSEISDLLRKLRSEPIRPEGIRRLRVELDAPLDTFVGIRYPSKAALLQFEVPPLTTIPASLSPTSGLMIEAELLGRQGEHGLRYTIALNDPTSESIFVIVCADLLSSAGSAGSPSAAISSVSGRIEHWAAFFARHGFTGLSREHQQGLFGEVWILKECLAPSDPMGAVQAWQGPLNANQDYQLCGAAIEVKSSIANPLQEIAVTNARQLDDLSFERIALILVEMDRIANSETSLTQLVDQTSAFLAHVDPAANALFRQKLILAGYLDAHASEYEAYGYSVRAVRAFRVSDGFPRITQQDLSDGVGNVRYSISVAALVPYEVDAKQEFRSFMEGTRHDA